MSTSDPRSMEAMMRRCGVPKRYERASFGDFTWKPDYYVSDQGSLFVTGPRGVGKTHFLCACIREICEEAVNGNEYEGFFTMQNYICFLPVPEFLLQIKQTYNQGAKQTEENILTQYSKTRVLALDDLGAERVSDWSIQMLYLLIDRRYRDLKQTFLSSNLSLPEIGKKLDDRIASRIAEMCIPIKFHGEDRRAEGKDKGG